MHGRMQLISAPVTWQEKKNLLKVSTLVHFYIHTSTYSHYFSECTHQGYSWHNHIGGDGKGKLQKKKTEKKQNHCPGTFPASLQYRERFEKKNNACATTTRYQSTLKSL
jgi:hypothetical protein